MKTQIAHEILEKLQKLEQDTEEVNKMLLLHSSKESKFKEYSEVIIHAKNVIKAVREEFDKD